MRRTMFSTLLAATMIAVAGTAGANHECETDEGATPVTVGEMTFYVVYDDCQPVVGDGTCVLSVWVFEETNGTPGLQRGDQYGIEHCEPDAVWL